MPSIYTLKISMQKEHVMDDDHNGTGVQGCVIMHYARASAGDKGVVSIIP